MPSLSAGRDSRLGLLSLKDLGFRDLGIESSGRGIKGSSLRDEKPRS